MRSLPLARPVVFLVLALFMLADCLPSRADLVYLKDGFVLAGRVRQPGTFVVDKGASEAVWVPKGNFFMVDDRGRFIVFGPQQVRDSNDTDIFKGHEVLRWQRTIDRRGATGLSSIVQVQDTTPWDDNWEREYKVQTLFGQHNVKQRLVELTPHYAKLEATKYLFSTGYLTRELGPDTVRHLLYRHPDLLDKGGRADPARRMRIYRFLVQCGWFDQAEQELDMLVKDLPDQKAKVEEAREGLQRLRNLQLVDDIEKAHKAGQHRAAQKMIADFPKKENDEKLLTRVRTVRDKYEKGNEDLDKARRFLKELPPKANQKQFTAATADILDELTYDGLERLEKFINLSAQVEREIKQGRTPAHTPAELLALALSGWLLGNVSAELKPEVAQKLWRARDLVLEYQRTGGEAARRRLADDYQKLSERVEFDELAQLIRFLPPPEAEKDISARAVEMETPATGARKNGVSYVLKLPPEYQHGRAWPVLFVLHNGGEKPIEMLERFSELAAQHGYILVAPAWERNQRAYQHSIAEHAAVLDTLRDLRRRFQVDSDRVFLTGWGEGGTMAYDVGLSHPDQFAGVMPMSPQPRYFAANYWRNAQYLPLYVVTGDYGPESAKQNRRLFDNWVPRGYPALYVEYKGRPLEFFAAELPYLFDWMSRKKRADPLVELGRSPGATGDEFQTMRETDNRFWWLSGEIKPSHINDAANWNSNMVPAGVQARIFEGNQVNINVHGFQNLTIWVGRGLINLQNPVSVRINTIITWNSGGKPIQPSTFVLLEDFHQRGDRQRLYLARIDFNKLP